jgi:hypothetical protein
VLPAAEQLGTAELIAFDLRRTEGEIQRHVRSNGGLKAACADLVERTLESAQ